MVGPGRGTWIFAKPKNSLQSNEWIFQVNTFRWKGSNPVEESHWFLVACTFIIEPSGHVFGKNLGTRPGNSWECEAFQCEVFMAQELSVFFLREMSFLIPKNAPDLDVPVEFDIFSPNQNMWGEMRMKILTQKVFRLFHTPSHIQASWETWMGNTEKYWWVFTVVQSPLHQVTVIFVRHHITPVSCQPFILLCLPCFRCSTSSGCFGRRFWKILDTKITHRPRRLDHHSFSDGGEFFELHLEGCFLGE